MKWTKDDPVAPGFYWFRWAGGVAIVEFHETPRGLRDEHGDDPASYHSTGEWYGPVEPPK